jgi:hypothetical protein
MNDQKLDIEALREEFKRQMRRQRQAGRYGMIAGHAIIFAVFSIMNIFFLAAAGSGDAFSNIPPNQLGFVITPLILLWAGWGTGLLFHILAVLNEIGLFEKTNKRLLVSRAVADQLLREVDAEETEKVKRKPAAAREMRLTDEGELAPVEDELSDEQPRRQNARRDG